MLDDVNAIEAKEVQVKTTDVETKVETTEPKVETTVTEEKPKAETPEEKKAKYGKSAKERIGELTGKLYEKDRIIKELESKINKNLDQEPVPPNLKSYIDETLGTVDYDKYNEDLANYTKTIFDWRESKKINEEKTSKQEDAKKEKLGNWAKAVDMARTEIPDIEISLNNIRVNPVFEDILLDRVNDEVKESDKPIETMKLLDYLSKNQREVSRLNSLPPDKVLVELGKIEGKLESLTKNSSNAPKPPTPVDSSKDVSVKKDSELSNDEWWKRDQQKRLEEHLKKYK